MKERLAVALDLPGRAAILSAAESLADEVGVFKLGLEAFVAAGPDLVREVASLGRPIFLDLKLHDIPNTVGRASAAAVGTGAAILNCHAAGGPAMMREFADKGREAAAKAGRAAPRLIAVTILTSLDGPALEAVGLKGSPGEAALRLAVLAQKAGLDGVVCSPEEIASIRRECGAGFFLVVPGVRLAGAAPSDQKRIATPAEALRAGADLLVVGRPILAANDPVAAARAIVAEMKTAAFP